MRLPVIAQRLQAVQISAIVAMLLAMCLAGCGGGGGGGGSSATTPTSPSSPNQSTQQVGNETFTFDGSSGTIDAYNLIYNFAITSQAEFWVSISLPFNVAATVSPQELVKYTLWVGNAPPVPAAAGTPFAWQQFSVSPAAITVPAGYAFQVQAEYDVLGNNPFAIAQGRYVECSLYSGSLLVGSGSNALVANLPGGGPGTPGLPGAYCNTNNHGSDIWGAGFPISSFQPGTTYTIVWSVLSS